MVSSRVGLGLKFYGLGFSPDAAARNLELVVARGSVLLRRAPKPLRLQRAQHETWQKTSFWTRCG